MGTRLGLLAVYVAAIAVGPLLAFLWRIPGLRELVTCTCVIRVRRL